MGAVAPSRTGGAGRGAAGIRVVGASLENELWQSQELVQVELPPGGFVVLRERLKSRRQRRHRCSSALDSGANARDLHTERLKSPKTKQDAHIQPQASSPGVLG